MLIHIYLFCRTIKEVAHMETSCHMWRAHVEERE